MLRNPFSWCGVVGEPDHDRLYVGLLRQAKLGGGESHVEG